jgi:hypothetical protein
MTNNKTLHKAIERHRNKIEAKSKALRYIKTKEGRDKCLERIKEIESKGIRLEQLLQFNYLVSLNRV